VGDKEVREHLRRFIGELPEAEKERVLRDGPSRADLRRFDKWLKQAAEQAEREAALLGVRGDYVDDDDGIDSWPGCWV
jgi:hypothetical protein